MKLTPFLLFKGDCADAMAFYQQCLGGDLTVTYVRDTPIGTDAPPELGDKVAYAQLTNGDIEISATDWQHPTRSPKQGNTVGLYLTGGDELRQAFEKLSAGADPELLDPLRELPFGLYGHLADRFGVHWFFRGDVEPHG